jgi:hypothetical protein
MIDFFNRHTDFGHMRTYQNEHNMVLNFPRCLLLQTSKADNNAPDVDAIYNLKFIKT